MLAARPVPLGDDSGGAPISAPRDPASSGALRSTLPDGTRGGLQVAKPADPDGPSVLVDPPPAAEAPVEAAPVHAEASGETSHRRWKKLRRRSWKKR